MLKQKIENKERIGAIGLALITMLGAAAITRINRNFFKEITMNPAFAFNQISERENETAHAPIRFDDVITTQSHGGL